MIKTQLEYEVTSVWVEEFKRALIILEAEACPENIHPRVREAEIDAVREQIKEMEDDLAQYSSKHPQ